MRLIPYPGDPRIDQDDASPLADPGTRLGARTIDAFVPLAPFLLVYGAGAATGSVFIVRAAFGVLVLAFLTSLVINLVWLHRYGQTIGKRMLGIRIVRGDGSRAKLGRLLLLRIIGPGALEMLPILGSIFGLVNPLLIFSDARKCVHDHMADTLVIDVRGQPEPPGQSKPTTF
ncbi:MAG: RDD family protein [Deltaproteobacteria bacterium]|nr:MAG: RDD family protein [Deltaproteobacteria bacterium]